MSLGYRHYLKQTSAALLADLKALTIGQSDFADGTRIAQKYRQFRVEGNASVPASPDPGKNVFPGNTCNSDHCFFEFTVDNLPLSSLHFLRPARFTAAFAVLDGRVQYVEASLFGGPGNNGGIVEEINPRSDRQPTYRFPTPIGKPYLFVELTPSAPASIREHAFDLNVDCLIAFTDCDNPCDYLPLAWEDWKAEMDQKGWLADLRRAYPHCP